MQIDFSKCNKNLNSVSTSYKVWKTSQTKGQEAYVHPNHDNYKCSMK